MSIGDDQVLTQELLACRPAPNAQKIDELDKQARVPVACGPYGVCELGQAWDEAVITDAEQRAARNVANARGFDHQRTGPTPRETLIPSEYPLRDETIVARTPGHHRGHPRARL